jgi:hypothetical protein
VRRWLAYSKCVDAGPAGTSPYEFSGLCKSDRATTNVFFVAFVEGSTRWRAYRASGSEDSTKKARND